MFSLKYIILHERVCWIYYLIVRMVYVHQAHIHSPHIYARKHAHAHTYALTRTHTYMRACTNARSICAHTIRHTRAHRRALRRLSEPVLSDIYLTVRNKCRTNIRSLLIQSTTQQPLKLSNVTLHERRLNTLHMRCLRTMLHIL